jgi:hypothetical protein
MNRQELKQRLIEENVIESAYSLESGLAGEQYVLSDEGGGNWSVFYNERGQRIGHRKFNSEDEACAYMLKVILDDRTTRKKSR